MKEEKKTGSYYTPLDLIQFMVDYLEKEQQDFSNVLEPSAGDGRFLSLLLPKVKHIEAIEVFEEKVKQIQQAYSESKVEVKRRNFLDYVSETLKKYSLIIGNPPIIIFVFLLLTRFFLHFLFFIEMLSKSMPFP